MTKRFFRLAACNSSVVLQLMDQKDQVHLAAVVLGRNFEQAQHVVGLLESPEQIETIEERAFVESIMLFCKAHDISLSTLKNVLD